MRVRSQNPSHPAPPQQALQGVPQSGRNKADAVWSTVPGMLNTRASKEPKRQTAQLSTSREPCPLTQARKPGTSSGLDLTKPQDFWGRRIYSFLPHQTLVSFDSAIVLSREMQF